jgi:hypothetical protein
MKYDDGFICYLNGTLIAQSNAPAAPAFDSSAVIDRGGSQTSNYEIFNSATAQTALVPGNNVLAIQILNFSNGSTPDTDDQGAPNGSRALGLPLLEATFAQTPTYLASVTPPSTSPPVSDGTNSGPRTNVGPLISNTTRQPVRPVAGGAPIVIVSKVVPSLQPVASVELKYAFMFAAEVSVPMVDDGTGDDAVAGDNIYTAQIPTIGLGEGQMVRWRVLATDATGSTSTDPPFRDTTDNDKYFGTVAQETQTANSQLPVMHWFVQVPGASQSEGGTRCSLFFLGRFYDNVYVNLHGQSSSGFPVQKKSHDFNFSQDNRFTWKEGEKPQRAMNLITTWADKAKVRDTLAWESWAEAKHVASHWAQLIRVQQNGNFWGIYDMVENGDEDFLERAGLDSNGPLYKIYNSLESVALAEKKSREFEGTADLQALINEMNQTKGTAARRLYSYDNIDIPSLVNYLANNVLILNNDFGHKNYYVYRDTNGTGEWSVLPWDQDLAIGHTWTSAQNYFNDDIHSQGGLVLGNSSGNRVMSMIAAGTAPEMVQMFMRRLRTLMDTRLMAPGTTNSPLDQRINEMVDLMDPPGATFVTDADSDLLKWGYWTDGNGGGSVAVPANLADAAVHNHGLRKQALRILNDNPNPPNPSSTNEPEIGDTRPAFLPGRRTRLFQGNLTLAGQPIPAAQPAPPTALSIEQIDFNPSSGNTEEEFFVIKNAGTSAVDISGWKITGAVDYTFRGGTVINEPGIAQRIPSQWRRGGQDRFVARGAQSEGVSPTHQRAEGRRISNGRRRLSGSPERARRHHRIAGRKQQYRRFIELRPGTDGTAELSAHYRNQLCARSSDAAGIASIAWTESG